LDAGARERAASTRGTIASMTGRTGVRLLEPRRYVPCKQLGSGVPLLVCLDEQRRGGARPSRAVSTYGIPG
jgi:hypothetical protein